MEELLERQNFISGSSSLFLGAGWKVDVCHADTGFAERQDLPKGPEIERNNNQNVSAAPCPLGRERTGGA